MAANNSAETILTVDDDQGLVRLVHGVLQREGFKVITAGSGLEAIERVKRNEADLLLLDLKLRDIEGKELIATLADMGRAVPFVIITGQGDERTAVDMMKRGALDYLVKDLDFLQFVPQVVRRSLERVAKEKRLAKAEAQAQLMQTAIEQGNDGVMMTSADARDPEITYVNPAFSVLTGCRADELIGHPLSLLETLTGPWSSFRRSLVSDQPFFGETPIARRGGERRITDCIITPVLGKTGTRTHWAVLLRDITQRKRLERRQDLQRQVALLLADAGSIGETMPKVLQKICESFNWNLGELWHVDRSSNLLNYICSWPPPNKDRACSRKLSLAPGVGVLGRAWSSSQPVFSPDLAGIAEGSGRGCAEAAGLGCGIAFPIVFRGEVLSIMAFFASEVRPLDLDLLAFLTSLGSQIGQFVERKHAEDALRLSEANLAVAQQIAHVGSFEVNLVKTVRVHWSTELFRILGMDPSSKELLPLEYFRRMVHPEDRSRVQEAFNRSLRECSRIDQDYRIVRADGSVRHVHGIAEPVLGPENKVIKLVGTLHDITESKQLEQAVWEISEREQRRIGQDLHDGLGQQLTAIELMCESMRSDLQDARPELGSQAAQLGHLLRGAIRETRSLAHGLAAFKVDTGGLQEALRELAQATSSNGHIKCRSHCASMLSLKGTAAGHLYRIAQEAVNNAVKHARATEIKITLAERNHSWQLQVTDNGKGLPRKRGHGMGLQVMKHRASMIGAELDVRSSAGKGVIVTCTLRRNI